MSIAVIRASTGLAPLGALLVALAAGSSADAAHARAQANPPPEIYVMNADGSGEPTRLTQNGSADDAPVWSPDGTKIAFSTSRDGNYEIYVMNANGTSPQRLTTNRSADDAYPDWSPDGTKIAFNSDRDGNYEIYVMNANGTGQTNLTQEPRTDDLGPAWSPDGTKLAFHSEGDIYVMNANGTGETRLTSGADVDVFPDWAPDGTKLAFVGGGSTTGFIDVVNADGTGRTRLTHDASEYFPDWSRDGTKIAYTASASGSSEIFVMNADGSGSTNVTRQVRQAEFEPSWSPDGTRIAYSSVTDRTAPDVALAARSPQRVSRQRGVNMLLLCDEDCRFRISGTISIAGQRTRFTLKAASGRLDALSVKRVKLKLSAARARRLGTMVAHGKHARARISVRVTDVAGNTRTVTRRVVVRR
jgi:Tol biopolymer transport system component